MYCFMHCDYNDARSGFWLSDDGTSIIYATRTRVRTSTTVYDATSHDTVETSYGLYGREYE